VFERVREKWAGEYSKRENYRESGESTQRPREEERDGIKT